MLRQYVHIMDTAFISLLQPASETYNLFDDILLLSDGQIVYQCPRENVLEFFESMGFKCPQRKGVPDFLQEVTILDSQKQDVLPVGDTSQFISSKDVDIAILEPEHLELVPPW
ncbi:Pleiotropic drug resistance protein tur2 [Castilleja foliolosa]|uniref:Pleiotropic drug resistance protein tur2 n=1 Tax=Castilleja foliolosa TaxID=1961234 RepID=A0ABD3ENJ9_9LAMI